MSDELIKPFGAPRFALRLILRWRLALAADITSPDFKPLARSVQSDWSHQGFLSSRITFHHRPILRPNGLYAFLLDQSEQHA